MTLNDIRHLKDIGKPPTYPFAFFKRRTAKTIYEHFDRLIAGPALQLYFNKLGVQVAQNR